MNLQDIKAFVAFADSGSTVGAAKRLRLTQSATTRRLQRFEASMGGLTLLDRSVKPPVLTADGRQVLERCRLVLNSLQDLKSSAHSAAEPVGELRIGVAQGLGDVVLDEPLDRLRRRFPGLMLSVVSNWSAALVEEVRAGTLDCAVGVLIDGARVPLGLRGLPLGEDKIVILAARSLNLPRSRALQLRELSEHGWILHPHGCGYRALLERAHHQLGVRMKVVAQVYERDLRLSLIARGVGLGIATPRTIAASPLRRRLRVVEVAEFSPLSRLTLFYPESLGPLTAAVDTLSTSIAAKLPA